jgi:PAS domain S-box-containing protein
VIDDEPIDKEHYVTTHHSFLLNKCPQGLLEKSPVQKGEVRDIDKTKEQLLDELEALRQRIAELDVLETELKESNKLFRILFFSSPIGMYIVQDGNFQIVGHQLARIAGYDEDELIGKPYLTLVLPEDRNAVRVNAVKMLKGESSSGYEYRIITKRAVIKWVMETVAPVSYQGRRATLGNLMDITERKQAEETLTRMVGEIGHSNTELEQFAYVVSHDLQEPLRMISSYTQLLAKRYHDKLDTTANDYINYAVDGAQRMRVLLNDLLDYSRLGTQGKPFQPTNYGDVLNQAMTNLKMAIEESGASVTHDYLPTLIADEGQLVQLFQNLISNAIKFCNQESPRIHVSAETKSGVWVFSVRDNGIGIDPQHAQRIFDIFKRLHTREEYSGTGMGLAICRKIVERHGGHIWVHPQPGEGSTFYFTIPVTGGKSP